MAAGETTALNVQPPGAWRQGGRSSGQGGGSGGGGSGGAGGGGGTGSQAEYVDPRAEAPLPDKTGQYAAMGAAMGVFLGWASQFV